MNDPALEGFREYLDAWALVPDGAPFTSYTRSLLLPVRLAAGAPAMLKVPSSHEERSGSRVMAWWAGEGAATVFAWDEGTGALVLERAEGKRSLLRMVDSGDDEGATRILADTAATLHFGRTAAPPPRLVTLERWFRDLWPAAERLGGVFRASAATARELLAAPQDEVVLHGDLHHENVLDFGEERGWLAIDPKGLYGERGFDHVHHLFDRDVVVPPEQELVERQLAISAAAAGLDLARQRRWALAWAGLSAVWSMEDGMEPTSAVAVGEMMARRLAEEGTLEF